MSRPIEIVVDRLISLIEKSGTLPWTRPFTGHDMPYNPVTGTIYSGGNAILLWAYAMDAEFTSTAYTTFKGAQTLGGTVRRGESGLPVIYAARCQDEKHPDKDGNPGTRSVFRYYTVFNLDQCEGLDISSPVQPETKYPSAQAFFEDTSFPRPVVRTGSTPYGAYHPGKDLILMPSRDTAITEAHYWTTLFHETIHWTGHEKRLNRGMVVDHRSPEYAREELIAEIGAAYLAGAFLNDMDVELNSAIYLREWIQILKENPNILFSAGKAADTAVNYLGYRIPKKVGDS